MLREVIAKNPNLPEAYHKIGFLYEHGLSVDVNQQMAKRNYEKAAAMDYP